MNHSFRTLYFEKYDYKIETIHGGLPQSKREKVIKDIRSDKTDVLIATDVAARGLDIDDITYVINYDMPHDPEDYVHRVGRTARAQSKGMSVTMVSPDDRGRFGLIERFLGKKVANTKSRILKMV